MRINRREMVLLTLGGAVIFALFYYLFVVSPALSKQESVEKSIAKKEQALAEMMALKVKWDGFKRNQGESQKTLSQRGEKFTLLSFLEGISRKAGIHGKIQYMKPLPSAEASEGMKLVGMEIKLDGIGIDQLVNFLYEIEFSDKLLSIKRIKVQTFSKGEEQSLRVTLQVDTYTAA